MKQNVFFGFICADTIKLNSIVNEFVGNWIWSIFLIQITTYNPFVFIFFCVYWVFSGRYCKNFKNFPLNWGWQPFWKSMSYFTMRTLSVFSNLGFLISRRGLLYERDKNRKSWNSSSSSLPSNFFWKSDLWRNETICGCSCIRDLPCNLITFSGIALSVQQTQPYSHSMCTEVVSFLHCKIFKFSRKFCSFVDPNFLGLSLGWFVILVKTVRTVSMDSFVSIPAASTVLSNKS